MMSVNPDGRAANHTRAAVEAFGILIIVPSAQSYVALRGFIVF